MTARPNVLLIVQSPKILENISNIGFAERHVVDDGFERVQQR